MRVKSMPWKFLLTATLALAALAALGFSTPAIRAAVASAEEESSAGPETEPAEAAAGDRQVVVYYFHGERRCKTCRTIEAFAEEVIQGRFAKQLDSGALAWRTVNFDEPENEHFIEEFGLVSSSLVLVEMQGGKPARFEVLKEAWSLVRDKPAFDQYVLDAVRGYLG